MANKKKKRGLHIPLRLLVIALIVLAEIVVVLAFTYHIASSKVWVYTIMEAISILIVIVIINRRGNPSYKITWVIFILLIPFAGGVIYLVYGGSRIMPYLKKRMKKIEQKSDGYLIQDNEILDSLKYEDLFHFRQSKYLLNESSYPVYKNTSCEFVSPVDDLYPKILEELEKAERYIFIEFFILAEGKMWEGIHKILSRKAKQGVEVRIMFDDFGSIDRQYKGFVKNLTAQGIKVSVFNKLRPSIDIFMNNRNHRKMIIIDGKVAVTGGFNIADEYINQFERFGHWLDSGIILKGDAVRSFVVMFCNMWSFTGKKALDPKNYIFEEVSISPLKNEEGFVQPYSDGPLNSDDPAEGIYMQMLNSASKYVYIASPYLILDNSMISVLKQTAKAGVDVRIITPKIPDKWYVHPVTQFNYDELLSAGIRIYEYTPGFIHSKLFVSDDAVATVGTVNMDYRSFFFHFECGVWMCKTKAVADIKKSFLETLKKCEEIKLSKWSKRSVWQKFKQWALHIFAPFM